MLWVFAWEEAELRWEHAGLCQGYALVHHVLVILILGVACAYHVLEAESSIGIAVVKWDCRVAVALEAPHIVVIYFIQRHSGLMASRAAEERPHIVPYSP